MTYYPQGMPAFNERQSMNHSADPPAYAVPYQPPMRHNRGVSDGIIQRPGEEWVRGPDGSFYPPQQLPQRQRASAPPPRHTPQPSYNQNQPQNRYWES